MEEIHTIVGVLAQGQRWRRRRLGLGCIRVFVV